MSGTGLLGSFEVGWSTQHSRHNSPPATLTQDPLQIFFLFFHNTGQGEKNRPGDERLVFVRVFNDPSSSLINSIELLPSVTDTENPGRTEQGDVARAAQSVLIALLLHLFCTLKNLGVPEKITVGGGGTF